MPSEFRAEIAKRIDWEPAWNAGATMPQVFAANDRLFLSYLIDEPDPDWDGTTTRVVDPADDAIYPLALVAFSGCLAHRFGMFNDEIMGVHPLSRRGLEYYCAHIVEHSAWLEEIKTVHRSHRYFDETRWNKNGYKHYFLFFHDEMLEVIAASHRIETRRTTFRQAAAEMANYANPRLAETSKMSAKCKNDSQF